MTARHPDYVRVSALNGDVSLQGDTPYPGKEIFLQGDNSNSANSSSSAYISWVSYAGACD